MSSPNCATESPITTHAHTLFLLGFGSFENFKYSYKYFLMTTKFKFLLNWLIKS